ncbi:hypothetical protein CNR34_00070 [Pseudomonas phage nickie]|uniref:Uncharacterized protein n=1 Tax=Pseudomonas phage nickie TaxID=2048977 RepID=A0A2H4P734_9CAUD|nr:hypothetical protein FDJ16_gp095 [Pseudomonas phage nickie]ATW58003.1 hypothetical protein CNR34_00070 [Pseudomonas phage nickie]
MKEFLKSKWQIIEALFKKHVAPRIEKAGPVVSFLLVALTVVVGLAIAVAFVAGVITVTILAPGMIVGFFAWTYLELGATYFPTLSPVYLTIPYWHFAWGFAALILIWRCFRKGVYGKSATAGVKTTK